MEFRWFSGNFSVTLNGAVTSITRAFRIWAMLFPYVTAEQTKREQDSYTVNERLQKVLFLQA